MLAWVAVSEDLTGAGGSVSKMADLCGSWQEASVLCHMYHSTVMLKCLPCQLTPPERLMRQRERRRNRDRERERSNAF